LTVYDAQGNLLPSVAAKVPSIEDGDWQVFPDGRMQVTWKLKPDVKWHDGASATASDFVFGMQILRDRDLPFRQNRSASLISEMRAPDPQTLIVDWMQPYAYANVSAPIDTPAVPEHILGDLYAAGDKQAITNSLYWSQQFVGLGPYKLGEWVLGSHLEAIAFDDYFLGRPKIDKLVFMYVGDANVLYANLLSGAVDLVPFGSFQADQFPDLKRNWEGTGAGTAIAVFSGTRNYRFQLRDPTAAWARDARVRRALVQMLDRPTLAEGLTEGFESAADTVVSPDDPIYALLKQRGLPTYPFDLAQAQRLMADAGWTKGADGNYVSATGAPFTIEVRSTDFVADVKESGAVAGYWRAAGANPTIFAIPNASAGTLKNQMKHSSNGVLAAPLRDTHTDLEGFITAQIGTEASHWAGNNWGGYSNPTLDRLYDQSLSALDASARQGLIADMLKIEADDVASFDLFYDMAQQTVIFRKGIRGPGPVANVQLATAWNIHTWEMS
jgi:peptide/nickel transport system substrate-binding protein